MVIDKGAPENLISLCGQGVAKSVQLNLIARIDFVPSTNVSVLILTPAQPAAVIGDTDHLRSDEPRLRPALASEK